MIESSSGGYGKHASWLAFAILEKQPQVVGESLSRLQMRRMPTLRIHRDGGVFEPASRCMRMVYGYDGVSRAPEERKRRQ